MQNYFKEWSKVVNMRETERVLSYLSNLPAFPPIYPEFSNVFKAFELCNYEDLKVVMIGQDPYPQKDVATGILFGNKEGTINLSPSLELIKENVIDYTKPDIMNPIKFDTTLESWSKQGVLMLNSALTVVANTPGSHTMLWRPFMTSLLSELSDKKMGIFYVLFGEVAKTFKPYINTELNWLFEYKHPAYYERTGERPNYDVFEKINKILLNSNNIKINWYEKPQIL